MMLRIRFTRLNPTHHRFEAIRADGGVEMRELETRSFLTHDLVHYAVESEAGLANSFYGLLARGAGYDAMQQPISDEAMQTEFVVGPLQTAIKGEVDPEAFVVRIVEVQQQMGGIAPEWLTPDLIGRVVRRLRGLQGRWKATAFGEAMELEFPLEGHG
jgi:hypothetical protein